MLHFPNNNKRQTPMNPMLQDYERSRREKARKEKQYILELREQMEKEKQRKAKEKELEKQYDIQLSEKINRENKELEERNAQTGNPKSKRSRMGNQQQEWGKSSIKASNNQSGDIKEVVSMNFGEFSPIRQLNKKSSLKSSTYSHARPNIPYNSGYIKAKEELSEERHKIARFRNQLVNSSKRTFIRSAQSALDDLRLITTEIKNTSQTLPFLLPKAKPELGINLQFPKPIQQSNFKGYQFLDKLKEFRAVEQKQKSGVFGKGKFPELVLEDERELHGVKQFRY